LSATTSQTEIPVNAHVVVNVGRRDPDFVDLEPERAGLTMEMHRQVQRGHKCQQRDDEGKQLDVTIAARDQQNEQAASAGMKVTSERMKD